MKKSQHLQNLRDLGFTGTLLGLRRVECKSERHALRYCNDESYTEAWQERDYNATEQSVKNLFGGKLPDGFFINGDPRGYALKIESEKTPKGFYTDWGGYGILAPDDLEDDPEIVESCPSMKTENTDEHGRFIARATFGSEVPK